MSTKNQVKRLEAFEPTPTQKAFIKNTDKQVLLSGSFGAGKSRIGCEKGYILNTKYPGNRGLIVRDAYTDVRASTIEQTLLEEVIPESHIYEHNKTKHIIKHKTGTRGPNGEPILSEIQYHGLDSGKNSDGLPTKIGGQQYGWIFVDEGIEISKDAWIQLLGRLRFNGRTISGQKYKVPFRQIYTATNPASKSHWMYDWFFEKEKGTYFMMTAEELAEHVDAIPNDYVETMAESFTGMYFDRYVEGKWVASQGLVYNEYDSHVHRKNPKELPWDGWEVGKTINHGDSKTVLVQPPEDWRVYRAIDFGYNHPFVTQWWAYEPHKQLHVLFRELYRTEELIEDLAQEVKRYSKGFKVEKTFADPAQAENRASLKRHGVETTEAIKDIEAGIMEVKGELNHDEDTDPNLYFVDNALVHPPDNKLDEENKPTSTVEEITEYQWDDDGDNPVEGDDHGLDTMRYYVHSVQEGTGYSREELEEIEETFNSGF